MFQEVVPPIAAGPHLSLNMLLTEYHIGGHVRTMYRKVVHAVGSTTGSVFVRNRCSAVPAVLETCITPTTYYA